MHHHKLYKIDSKGKTRVWWIEYDEEKYRTHSGIDGGKIVVSGWQYPTAKNVGRANETTVDEQVEFEVEAEYTKKQNQGKYHPTVSAANVGAKFHECMLADKYDPKKHNKFPYFSQPKLDGCISGDSIVYTERGTRKVSDVYHSDDKMILSYNVDSKKREFKEINGRFKNVPDVTETTKKWKILRTSKGKTIKLTDNHRVFLPMIGVWRQVKNLRVGDVFLVNEQSTKT